MFYQASIQIQWLIKHLRIVSTDASARDRLARGLGGATIALGRRVADQGALGRAAGASGLQNTLGLGSGTGRDILGALLGDDQVFALG